MMATKKARDEERARILELRDAALRRSREKLMQKVRAARRKQKLGLDDIDVEVEELWP